MTITEIDLMNEFGCNLRDILKVCRMSQKDLADALGVCESTISQYTHCQRMPTLKTLVNIVNILECNVEDLISFDYFVE